MALAGKVAMDFFPETPGSFSSQCWGRLPPVPVTTPLFFFLAKVNHIVYSLDAKPFLAGLKPLLSIEA